MLARARAAGVARVDRRRDDRSPARARRSRSPSEHDGVYACLGIHPHEAASADADGSTSCASCSRIRRAVAVGETGLDYFRDYAPHDAQRRAVRGAARARPRAREARRDPHARRRRGHARARCSGFDGPVVLHCFSSPRAARAALERGWYVSFAGNVTYPNAPELRDGGAPRARRPAPRRDRQPLPRAAARPRPAATSRPSSCTRSRRSPRRAARTGRARAQIDANATRAFGAVSVVAEEEPRPALPRRREHPRRDRAPRRARAGRRRARGRPRARRADALPRRPRRARARRRDRPLARAGPRRRSRGRRSTGATRSRSTSRRSTRRRASSSRTCRTTSRRRSSSRASTLAEQLDALVRDGAARGRRPLLRRAGDEGVRRRLGARAARDRADRLPSRVARGLPAAAERRVGARRVPPHGAGRRRRS